jgi:hypothetical protein
MLVWFASYNSLLVLLTTGPHDFIDFIYIGVDIAAKINLDENIDLFHKPGRGSTFKLLSDLYYLPLVWMYIELKFM